jgi:hypothetical protein
MSVAELSLPHPPLSQRQRDRLDVRKAAALAGAWLRRDVRVGGGRLAFIAGLAFVLGGAFWTCAFAASKLAMSGAPRFVFATSGFLIAGGVITVMLAGQFAGAVLDPRDIELLGPRPVGARTYAAARVVSCGLYTIILGLPAHLPFALLGAIVPGSTVAFTPVYLVVAITSCVAGTTILILTYMTLARWFGIRRLHAALTFLQMLLSAAMWPLIPLVMQMGPPGKLFALNDSKALAWLPPAWLGAIVDVLLGRHAPRALALAGLGTISLVACIAVLPRFLSLDYVRTAYSQLAGLTTRYDAPRPSSWDPTTRAGFDLARWSIRDPRLLARLAPGLVMPFLYGIAIMVPFGDLDPYAPNGSAFGIVPAAMMAMMPPGFLIALQRSDRWRAGFIFEVAPLRRPSRVVLGVELAAGLLYLLPAGALVLWGAARWPLTSAGLLGLDLAAALGVTLAAAPLFVDRLPFCMPFEASSGLREQTGMIAGMALPLSVGFAVRASTPGNLLGHAAIDLSLFAIGLATHSGMLGLLNRRLLRNFGRGQAAHVDTHQPRWTSRAVGLTFGLAGLGLGSIFTALPAVLDGLETWIDGEHLTLRDLRAAGSRRAARLAMTDDDTPTADRLMELAKNDDKGFATTRLDAEVALRRRDIRRASADLDALSLWKNEAHDMALLGAQVKLLRGDCLSALTVLSSLARGDSDSAPRAYHDLAVAHAQCGQTELAGEYLDAHLQVHPRDPIALRNRERLRGGKTQLEFSVPRAFSLLDLR